MGKYAKHERVELNICRITDISSGSVRYRVEVYNTSGGTFERLEDAREARDRLRAEIASKRAIERKAQQRAQEDNARCMQCVFHWIASEEVCCEYILRTGHRRGCDPGLACDKFLPGNKQRCIIRFGDAEWPELELVKEVAQGKQKK